MVGFGKVVIDHLKRMDRGYDGRLLFNESEFPSDRVLQVRIASAFANPHTWLKALTAIRNEGEGSGFLRFGMKIHFCTL